MIRAIPKDMLQPSEDIDDTRSSLSGFAAIIKTYLPSINIYLIACRPTRLSVLNHSVWLFVDVRIIAVAEIISTRLSLADLYTLFARYHRRRYCHLHARHSLSPNCPHHLEP